jgi:hypothetical protein
MRLHRGLHERGSFGQSSVEALLKKVLVEIQRDERGLSNRGGGAKQ